MPTIPTKVIRSFETYRDIGVYEQVHLTQAEPSSFNGRVSVRRYRITVEEILESPGTIGTRIQALWDHCENHHHWAPLRAAAKEVCWELVGNAGRKVKRKK